MANVRGTSENGLYGATLGFFFGFAAVALFGPTAKNFQDLMGLTAGQVGLLVAMPSLSGSLLRIPFGAWSDATGGRKPFLVLLVLAWLGMLGLSLFVYTFYPDHLTASMYPLLLLLGVLIGCGIAVFSVGSVQVSYWFPQEKQGYALGFYAGLGTIAPGIFSLIIPFAVPALGLTGSYIAWFLFLTLGIIIYWRIGINAYYFQLVDQGVNREEAVRVAKEKGQRIFPKGNAFQGLIKAARAWKTWALAAIYFITFGGFIALTAWFPTYWTSFYQLTLLSAGMLTALFSMLASIIRVWGGKIADRIGGVNSGTYGLMVMLLGAIVMTFSHSYGLSVVGEIIMAVGMGVANGAVFKLVPEAVPEAVGGATGWVGGLGAFGGFVVPPILGMFVQRQGMDGYASGFIIYAILAVVSIILLQMFKKKIRN